MQADPSHHVVVPSNGVPATLPSAPSFMSAYQNTLPDAARASKLFVRSSTVDQEQRIHRTGLSEMALVDVVTDLTHLAMEATGTCGTAAAWQALDEEDRAWWTDIVDRQHAVDVAIAECPSRLRADLTRLVMAVGQEYDMEDDLVLRERAVAAFLANVQSTPAPRGPVRPSR